MENNEIHIKDLFNEGFKEYSTYNTFRSIPSVIDGLKNGQRKCVYGVSVLANTDKTVKVASLAGSISSMTEYHHGETSLADTIVGLAQGFTGSNNINIFYPDGQFGNILNPKGAAAHRYIFTRQSSAYPYIFRKEDSKILDYQMEEGKKIEPVNFYPIIPLCLVNGSKGIGTGYATNILNYDPVEIINELVGFLTGKKKKIKDKWIPHYHGFKGSIARDPESPSRVIFKGVMKVTNTTTIEITCLPLGISLIKYKEHLNKLEDAGFIKEYSDFSNEESFKFIVKVPRSTTNLSEEALFKKFKLESKDSENLNLWKGEHLKCYDTVREIMEDFVEIRSSAYEARRSFQLDEIKSQIDSLSEKMKFIKWYLKNSLQFTKLKKDQLIKKLEDEGFNEIDKLIRMQFFDITREQLIKLKEQIVSKKEYLKELKATTASELWISDLKDLKTFLTKKFYKEAE